MLYLHTTSPFSSPCTGQGVTSTRSFSFIQKRLFSLPGIAHLLTFLSEGKLTLIMLHAYNAANRAEKAKIDRIYKKERTSKTKAEIDFLAYVIEKYGSVEYARGEAIRYGRLAQEKIKDNESIFPENEFKEVFKSAVEGLFIRKI